MKHWGLRLFNLAAAVSLLLCIAMPAVWLRNRNSSDWIWFSLGGSLVEVRVEPYGAACIIANGWDTATKFEHSSWASGRLPTGPDFAAAQSLPVAQRTLNETTLLPGVAVLSGPATVIFRDGRPISKSILSSTRPVVQMRWFSIRYSVSILYSAILPMIWGFMALRRWRIRLIRGRVGLCPTCGYDLRATPERCPECGTVAPPTGIEAAR